MFGRESEKLEYRYVNFLLKLQTMEILVHIILAIFLFFIQNWIGGKSYSRGYIKFSILDDKDEAQSINFVIKVFGPIIFLIISASIFQYLNIAKYNFQIIQVIYFYIILRITLIFLWERVTIVNWGRIIFYYISLLLLSIIFYNKLIKSVNELLPDFKDLKNEIWLLILAFIYKVGNGPESINKETFETENTSLPELTTRKRKYIDSRYKYFQIKYSKTIESISQNSSFNLIIYSILIFENFNRPRIVRFFERIWLNFTSENVTQGVMQVSSHIIITDEESVFLGTKQLYDKFEKFLKDEESNFKFSRTIKKHCPDKKYIRQILYIAKAIIDNSFNKGQYIDILEDIKYEFSLYDYEIE